MTDSPTPHVALERIRRKQAAIKAERLAQSADEATQVKALMGIRTSYWEMLKEAGQSQPESGTCSTCHGFGYLRVELPATHPNFGKPVPCECTLVRAQIARRAEIAKWSRAQELRRRGYTFEAFMPNGANLPSNHPRARTVAVAFTMAKTFAEKPEGFLVFQGYNGCGKTHLAGAIIDYLHRHTPDTQSVFFTAAEALAFLRAGMNDEVMNYQRRLELLRGCQLLVLDDFGAEAYTDWGREQLFLIIDSRYFGEQPTIITTNLTIRDIERIDLRLGSRLTDMKLSKFVTINAPDFRQGKEHAEQGKSLLPTYDEMRFNTYKADTANRKQILAQVQEYADAPRHGWLMFLGQPLTGKTHLAAAVAHYRQAMGDVVIFTTLVELLNDLRQSMNVSKERSQAVLDVYSNVQFLVIDGVSEAILREWGVEQVVMLMKRRRNMPTVLTAIDKGAPETIFNQVIGVNRRKSLKVITCEQEYRSQ